MNDPVMSALSLCRKAGALRMGADAAAEALRGGAALAVYTSDASERTVKKLSDACRGEARAVPLARTMDDMERALGRRFAVAAIDNGELAGLVLKKLSQRVPSAAEGESL